MKEFLGLQPNHAQASAEIIAKILANSYMLFLKTQNFHWNVKGIYFKTLHSLFEEQYKQLLDICDDLAERISTLGQRAPSSFKEFMLLATIEENSKNLSDIEMLQTLRADYSIIVKLIRVALLHLEDFSDEGSISLFGEILLNLEKNLWVVNNHLIGL